MINRSLLNWVLSAQTSALLDALREWFGVRGYDVTVHGDDYILATPRPAPTTSICLVAHVDTVPRRGVQLVSEGCVITNACGPLGADDRAGVYAILHLIQETSARPIVVLTNHEESGCAGAYNLVAARGLDSCKDQLRLFVELDRQGYQDYVCYTTGLPESTRAFVERYGWREAIGTFSDVKVLTEEYLIPHVNLSVGYWAQHTSAERLDIAGLMATIVRVDAMLHADVPWVAPEVMDKLLDRWEYNRSAGYYNEVDPSFHSIGVSGKSKNESGTRGNIPLASSVAHSYGSAKGYTYGARCEWCAAVLLPGETGLCGECCEEEMPGPGDDMEGWAPQQARGADEPRPVDLTNPFCHLSDEEWHRLDPELRAYYISKFLQ